MHSSFNTRKSSKLYHLEPMNVSAGSVESLTSYLTRLSEAHLLPVQDMVEGIVWPLCCQSGKNISYRSEFYQDYSKSINGVGIYANDFSKALGQLTLREELRNLTMLPLEGIIDSGGKGLLKKKKEWCPRCYAEQKNNYGFMYDPLRWSLSLVKRCEIHKVELNSVCPECGKEQWSLSRYTPLGRCIHCGADLSEENGVTGVEVYEDDEWTDWVERNLNTLFKMSNDLDNHYAEGEFCFAIAKIVDDVSNGNALQLDRRLGFGDCTISQWRRNRYKPRFDFLVKFAYGLGADLIDVLNYHKCGDHDAFIKTESRKPTPKTGRSDRKIHDHYRIEKELERIINEKIPKSASDVMKQFGVSHGYLNYRFPEKIKKISTNYKLHLKNERREKFQKRADSIRNAINALHMKGEHPSRREVFKLAEGVGGRLSANQLLRKVWRNEMIRLGYLES